MVFKEVLPKTGMIYSEEIPQMVSTTQSKVSDIINMLFVAWPHQGKNFGPTINLLL